MQNTNYINGRINYTKTDIIGPQLLQGNQSTEHKPQINYLIEWRDEQQVFMKENIMK